MHLADQRAVRRVASHAILARIGPAHAAPDIALDVGPHPVGEAGREILGEDTPAMQPPALNVEHPDMRGPAMRDAAIDDIEQRLVGRKGEAVRADEVVGDNGGLPARGIEPIHMPRQFRIRRVAFVGTIDAVARIGEPDRAVGGHDDVVRRIQAPALVAVHQDRDAAVRLGAGDPARVVLAGEQAPLPVARVAVGMVAVRTKHADMPVILEPAHDPVVRDVAPQQVAAIGEIHRPLRPAEPGGDALDRGIPLTRGEAPVEGFHCRQRVACARQVAERQRRMLPEGLVTRMRCPVHLSSPLLRPSTGPGSRHRPAAPRR